MASRNVVNDVFANIMNMSKNRKTNDLCDLRNQRICVKLAQINLNEIPLNSIYIICQYLA